VKIPVPKDGEAVGILKIPRLHLDMVVVQGTTIQDLMKGPGHYPGTAFPWSDHGRVAIAGHRTTYLRPFWALDTMRPGDRIQIQTEFGTFEYRVTGLRVVLPTAMWVARQTSSPTLVLTTCNPRFSSSQRIAVFAVRM
jgi:sortase A